MKTPNSTPFRTRVSASLTVAQLRMSVARVWVTLFLRHCKKVEKPFFFPLQILAIEYDLRILNYNCFLKIGFIEVGVLSSGPLGPRGRSISANPRDLAPI